MKEKFVMVLDYATSEAYQVELSEEDVVKMNENPDDWWEDYRRKNWFSSNCARMASKKPMNVCIDSTEESEVTVKNRQGEKRIQKVSL
jgi:hypothetical protein